MKHFPWRPLAAVAVAASLLAACGDDGDSASKTTTTTTATAAAASSATSLKGICPADIVVQIDWYATPERAAMFQMIGPGGTFDAKKGTFRGPLGDTGVDMEVRMGGNYIGFQPIPAQMYQDDSIFMGLVATDDAVQASQDQPTVAVMAPLDINPQILMWDPATYPDIKHFPDVAKSGAKVMYIEGLPFMDYLVSKGYVKKSQLDASYDGTPSRFIAADGKLIQQAYLSSEPYRWEHDVPEWNKPVKSLLIDDSGYRIYPQGLAVKPEVLKERKDCLKKLVPMVQQAQVDYMKDPTSTNQLLAKIADQVKDGPPITVDGNTNAVKVMKESGIVGNGPNGTLGDFDMHRIDETIAQLRPIFADRGTDIADDLKASDIVTNEFIDKNIHL